MIYGNDFFKSGGDDVIKSADEVLRGTKNQGENVINTSDDLLRDIKNKQIGNTSAQADEALVLERIGADNHIVEFKTLKKSSRTDYIQHLKKHGDELIDNDVVVNIPKDHINTEIPFIGRKKDQTIINHLENICLQFFIIKICSVVESNRSLVIGHTSLIGCSIKSKCVISYK